VRVRSGAVVTRAVLDDRVEVGEGASVGGDGDITLVGRQARVDRDSEVPAGARLPDPDRED
jgi:glucose-1-phosphate adenylyltransferase